MRIMSVDPSVNHIGIAYIINGKYEFSLTFRTDEKKSIIGKLKEISAYFHNLDEKVDVVIVEQPDTFVRMGRYGVLNGLPIMLLFMSIGAIVSALSNRYDIEFVKVSDWKGKTPKQFTQRSVEGITGVKLNDHESDAVMMGFNYFKSVMFKNAVRRGMERSLL